MYYLRVIETLASSLASGNKRAALMMMHAARTPGTLFRCHNPPRARQLKARSGIHAWYGLHHARRNCSERASEHTPLPLQLLSSSWLTHNLSRGMLRDPGKQSPPGSLLSDPHFLPRRQSSSRCTLTSMRHATHASGIPGCLSWQLHASKPVYCLPGF